MRKQFLIFISVVISLSFFFNYKSSAQIEAAVARKNLMKFCGGWKSDVTLSFEGKEYKVEYNLSAYPNVDSSAISMEESFSHPELGDLDGYNLIGYDIYSKQICWYSVDNMNTCHAHYGKWVDGNHLVIEYNGTRDGEPFIERIEFKFIDEKNIDFLLVATLGGKPFEKASGTFTRATPEKFKPIMNALPK